MAIPYAYDLEDLATRAMTGGLKESDILESGWVYRKGKSFEDVRHAAYKSKDVKKTFAKLENEISMMEVYLKDILKKPRVSARQSV